MASFTFLNEHFPKVTILSISLFTQICTNLCSKLFLTMSVDKMSATKCQGDKTSAHQNVSGQNENVSNRDLTLNFPRPGPVVMTLIRVQYTTREQTYDVSRGCIPDIPCGKRRVCVFYHTSLCP